MPDHPITPPPELVREWIAKFWDEPVEDIDPALGGYDLAARAAQWGANQELQACCKWLVKQGWFSADEHEAIEELRASRRPKPPSLKKQALNALMHLCNGASDSMDTTEAAEYISRALEQLDD